ncbi:superoxide dismutase [Xylariaceae sp. FL1651]|nr:superoxide dismutase [Xylariaceae sp. FL1651]
MRLSSIISLAAAGASGVFAQNGTVTGKLGDATVVTNNTIGKQAIAVLPNDPFWKSGSLNGNIKGSLKATSGANGVGVDYEVTFSNLPTEGGPFAYHIHVNPVDTQGNCTNTLAHLDPFIRGENPVCDSSKPATCQVGDLSGKYGKITSDPFTAKYHDDFTAMSPGPGSYFLNRSLVIHFANKTRITCTNFAIRSCNSTGSTCQPTVMPYPGGVGALNVVKSLALLPLIVMLFNL